MGVRNAPAGEPAQQPQYRDQIIATDQHGRRWEADIELATMAPVGEPHYVPATDRVTGLPIQPQILPPPHFMRWTKRGVGRVEILYDAWIAHQRARVADWQQQLENYATSMYGEEADRMLQNPPPRLLNTIGAKPYPYERVEAAQRGNKWVLGLPMPDGTAPKRPEWADKFFPRPKPVAIQEFPDAEPVGEENPFPDADQEPTERFPVNYAPGRWRLSDGSKMQGTRDEAEAAEAELQNTLELEEAEA